MRGIDGTDLDMNYKRTILDSLNDAGGFKIFVVSTISSVKETAPGWNGVMKVFPLEGTFKMNKEVSDIYPDG